MPGSSNNRRDMPGAYVIRNFWALRLSRGRYRKIPSFRAGMGVGLWCFACGARDEIIHRAHIKPLWAGGDNSILNLHNLCTVCHVESEDIWDRPYWRWFFKRTRADTLDALLGLRPFGEGIPTMPRNLTALHVSFAA